MLPGALFSTYKQYKEDTNKVVEWLANTARSCGYQPAAAEPAAPKGPKLKGRARKLARDAAAASAKQASSTKEYHVKTRDFVPMAEAIANSKDLKVIIPVSILKTWKNCITARTDTAKWYEMEIDPESQDIESNESHNFFINVLRRALQVLVPVAKLQELDKNHFRVQKPTTNLETAPVEEVTNLFSHLEIQDLNEEMYEKLPDVVGQPKPVGKSIGPKPKYTPDDLDETSEYLFALECLMIDIQNLQEQLKECWQSYADAETDLTTASVTTCIAIEMIKRAEEEFLNIKQPSMIKQYPEQSISWMWFIECCIRDGIPSGSQRDDKYFVPMEAWEQAQESYLHLSRFVQVYSNGTTPGRHGRDRIFAVTRPAYFGTYNPELEYEDLSAEKQYEQIAALVNDMLVTIGGFVMLAESPNDDMLMNGIVEIQQNEITPPMWVLFAVQNFVDIHFILKTRSERPYEELRDFALSAVRTLKDHQAFLEKHPLTKMRSQEDEDAVHETLREIEEWVLEDKIKQTMNSVQQQGPTKKRRIFQDFEVLRMSPVLCGMMKYCFHIQMQWKGITLVNDIGIVTAAHMYNALQQNGYLGKQNPLVWEDMEYLLDLHKAEDTFMGARPRTIEDCTKRLALVQGVAPTTFARRRRGNNNRVLRSRAGSKFLSPSTSIAQVLGQKYLNEGVSDWHLDQLDAIIGRKFDRDMKAMKEYDEKMNASVAAIDTSTEEGKLAILDLFAPALDYQSIAEKTGRKEIGEVSFKKVFAEIALEKHAPTLDSKWSRVVQEVVNEFPDESTKDGKGKSESDSDSSGEESEPEGTETRHISEIPDDSTRMDHPAMTEVIERWRKDKTLPLDIFVDILRDSLAIEYLDIQFDYFAFFRSAFSLMLEIKNELAPILRPRVEAEENPRILEIFEANEGAVCVVPQLALLCACDPLEAPNIITLRPWLEVDYRPLQLAARIMKPWIEENGDIYCDTEEEREDKRTKDVLKEGPKVKYVDDDVEGSSITERKVGWSSALGVLEGLNAREMREIFDAQKGDGFMGETVAETMARLKGIEMNEYDKELAEMRTRWKEEYENRPRPERGSEVPELTDSDEEVD